jgi:hypothetical protein
MGCDWLVANMKILKKVFALCVDPRILGLAKRRSVFRLNIILDRSVKSRHFETELNMSLEQVAP